ncbi:3-dehydrosphinganine reductase TSC10A [Dioscorea cayenensis subsp. rotundata]|uniref:3-dehydrosphinganine reductase n=1 Tax=Dioscorea cayennensis subsp. rotundata TaxID=55577 RepID=A0AB40CWF2_DIOCR|nr:3-dehydrosphinganine reductase TSC10A [Dioscorea cayenensis subsp. rotundata]
MFSIFSTETLDLFSAFSSISSRLHSMASPYLLLLLLIPVLPLIFLLVLAFLARPRPAKVPVKGRHVFITGGSSGIGLAMALQAASEGARVSILARNQAKLEEARDTIRLATGKEVTILSADVRDAESVARAIEEAGPIDILIANQGVFIPQELELQDMKEIRFQVEVNLMGTFHLIKAALPGMRQNTRKTGLPASIAIISSQAGQVGVYGYTAYSASKFALRGLAEALQHEVISDKIHVSLVFPPDTETPGLAEEQKRRPELTNLIVASSGGMKADAVAKKALDGIKSGTFIVSCNFEGVMLAIATAGLSPQSSYLTAFFEVFGAGFMRFVGLCFQWNWFTIIEKFNAKNNRS